MPPALAAETEEATMQRVQREIKKMDKRQLRVPEAEWIRAHEALPPTGVQVWVITESLTKGRHTSYAWLMPNEGHTGYRWVNVLGDMADSVLAWWPLPGKLAGPGNEHSDHE
jgi:hypothetical protein